MNDIKYNIKKETLKADLLNGIFNYEFDYSLKCLKKFIYKGYVLDNFKNQKVDLDQVIFILKESLESSSFYNDKILLFAFFLSFKGEKSYDEIILNLLEPFDQSDELVNYIYVLQLINSKNYEAAYYLIENYLSPTDDFFEELEDFTHQNAQFVYLKGICELKLGYLDRASLSFLISFYKNKNEYSSLKYFYKTVGIHSKLSSKSDNILIKALKSKISFKYFRKAYKKNRKSKFVVNNFLFFTFYNLKTEIGSIKCFDYDIDYQKLFENNISWKSVFSFSNPFAFNYDNSLKEGDFDSYPIKENGNFYNDSLDLDQQEPEFWDNI